MEQVPQMKDDLSLGFVGDISFARTVADVIAAKGPDHLFAQVRPHYDRHDLVIGNLECAIVDDGARTAAVARPLWAPAHVLGSLSAAGISVVTLANNHMMDCGVGGLRQTMAALDAERIRYFGAGETLNAAEAPLSISVHGRRIAFIGACDAARAFASTHGAGIAPYAPERLIARVREIRDDHDLVVVALHADQEFVRYPAPHRHRLSHRLTDAGATMVIQHHPHVIQGIECDGRRLIAYSLGNHVFAFKEVSYQGVHEGTRDSMLLSVDVRFENANAHLTHEVLPMDIDDAHRPVPCAADAAARRITEIGELSHLLQDRGFLRRHWWQVCRKNARNTVRRTYYTARRKGLMAAIRQNGELLRKPHTRRWIAGFLTFGIK